MDNNTLETKVTNTELLLLAKEEELEEKEFELELNFFSICLRERFWSQDRRGKNKSTREGLE